MAFLDKVSGLLQDPPPEFLFEVSEAGIAYMRPGPTRQVGFEPLENDVISVSPLRDNVLRPDPFAARIQALVGPNGNRKRRKAVLILPDFCARVAVMEFDSLPKEPEEQAALVRFRMKKSVPFDVEAAALGYYPQPSGNGKSFDVVVVVAALDIVAKYEAPFRAAGLQTGMVTTATVASVDLETSPGIHVCAKLSGRILTLSVLRNGVLKLVRSVELPEVTHEEVMNVLFPTVAFIEDELSARPDRLVLCGIESTPQLETELGIPVQPLRSRLGTPTPYNAGLLGYLESSLA